MRQWCMGSLMVIGLLLVASPWSQALARSAPALKPAPITYRTIAWDKAPLRTFYANPVGRGNGRSRARPMAFNRLLGQLRPGDRVILLNGTYPKAKISLRGHASRPIRIEAEYPVVRNTALTVANWKKVMFKQGLQIEDSSYLRIKGLSFEVDAAKSGSGIEVLSGNNLAFVQNLFRQNTNYGLLFNGLTEGDVRQVLVEHNVFHNMIRSTERGGIGSNRMDYGLRVHGADTVIVRRNLFDGYFNHALSVKEKVKHILIERNTFKICGPVCIEGGQEPDTAFGRTVTDRTAANMNVRNNRFTGGRLKTTGVFARNVERIFITGNSFKGIAWPLRMAGHVLNARSCERQLQVIGRKLATCEPGSRLTLVGRKTVGVLFERNRVAGSAAIYAVGRGQAGDFLSIRFAHADRPLPVSSRRFVLDGARVNRWAAKLPATLAAPRTFIAASSRIYLKNPP